MKAFSLTETDHSLKIEFFLPGSANALSLAAARELKALQKKHAKTKKPLIVASKNPRVFCSGGNLSDYKKLKGKEPGLKVNREIASILDAFADWPAPKLALIEADALGGGVEWLARFDFRWMTPNSYLVFWQKRIGLSTGWRGGGAWSAKIGEDRVRRLLMESAPLNAERALREGLADRIVSGWRIHAEAELWAQGMAGDVTARLGAWSAKGEAQTFKSLWMAPAHARALKSW